MKKWFSAGLLLLGASYTFYGLYTLTLLTSSGRPAAGFFPLLVGILLVMSCAINLWNDLIESTGKHKEASSVPETSDVAINVKLAAGKGSSGFGKDVVIVFVYICGFVAVMSFIGALLSMILFMLVYLFTFNQGHLRTNLIYSAALPAFLYGLFKILLNASLPVGPFGF